ncbi:MAG TPA: MFS transporter [Acidimicrobiales bacterium]|nr:MFS transporter [Acidimicrobiales bacterium]
MPHGPSASGWRLAPSTVFPLQPSLASGLIRLGWPADDRPPAYAIGIVPVVLVAAALRPDRSAGGHLSLTAATGTGVPLPTIQRSLHTSQATVTWVLTAYLLSASIFTPIMGRVGDMVGKKRVFIVTLAALALGSLIAAVAHDIGVMIVARAIQGVGGGVMPLAFGIIRDEFPRARVAGAVGALAALTARAGRLRAGRVAEHRRPGPGAG